jgi:hypothetical protein
MASTKRALASSVLNFSPTLNTLTDDHAFGGDATPNPIAALVKDSGTLEKKARRPSPLDEYIEVEVTTLFDLRCMVGCIENPLLMVEQKVKKAAIANITSVVFIIVSFIY